LAKELDAQRVNQVENESKYGELSAYLSASLVHEQTEGSAAADYLDDDAVALASEAAQLEIVQKSLSEERKKLGPLRAARKLAEKRRKDTHAGLEKMSGFSDGWLDRHAYGQTADSVAAELDELDLELQKEDLLLQQDRLRLQSSDIEVAEPHRGGRGGRDREYPDVDTFDSIEEELRREAKLLDADLKRRHSEQE
jgi:hypothetical protein